MRLTLVVLASPTGPREWLQPRSIAALLHRAARPEDLLEHVSVSCGPNHVIAGLHTLHPCTDATVPAAMEALVDRALRADPGFAGWHVVPHGRTS
ncbi:hypothetical protein [Streptomyces sp. NK15101]|uniref:hypothetical protein n=1 Tax=Streptomyces sp. NK15101 TaxID=2873261 RepID=UPI001CED5D34|nr:hypothetical protein [Streptomyces sp. NK15101]